jgi:hypothetical protein
MLGYDLFDRDDSVARNLRRHFMQPKLVAGVSVGILGLSALATQALAHHGWSGQGGEDFSLKGTVATPVSLSGPHATMQIKDAEGQVWDLTLAAAPRLKSAGLEEGVIPVGAEVTIIGKRNLDPKKLEAKTERVTYNGKNYDVYPELIGKTTGAPR